MGWSSRILGFETCPPWVKDVGIDISTSNLAIRQSYPPHIALRNILSLTRHAAFLTIEDYSGFMAGTALPKRELTQRFVDYITDGRGRMGDDGLIVVGEGTERETFDAVREVNRRVRLELNKKVRVELEKTREHGFDILVSNGIGTKEDFVPLEEFTVELMPRRITTKHNL